MQMAVRPAIVSRQACALATVTVAVEKTCAASCKAWLKQVSEARNLVSANSQVRGRPAGKIQGKITLRRSNLLAKQASCLP